MELLRITLTLIFKNFQKAFFTVSCLLCEGVAAL